MKEAFNNHTAEDFIADHYGDRATPPQILRSGPWTRAYSFSLDGREAVVRLGAHVEDFLKDERMAVLAAPQLPIPRVIEIGATYGGYFAVSERHYGQALDRLDELGLRAVLPTLLRTLDAIRDLNTSASDGYGNWSPDRTGPFASWQEALLDVTGPRPRIAGWREALEKFPEAMSAFEVGVSALRKLLPGLPNERHYIHGDLLYQNVLVDGTRISAVLDWGNSMYGDHLYDAAWLLYWWPWYPAWRNIDIRQELDSHWQAQGGLPGDVERRLLAYQLHIGLDGLAWRAYSQDDQTMDRNTSQVLSLVHEAANGSHLA